MQVELMRGRLSAAGQEVSGLRMRVGSFNTLDLPALLDERTHRIIELLVGVGDAVICFEGVTVVFIETGHVCNLCAGFQTRGRSPALRRERDGMAGPSLTSG